MNNNISFKSKIKFVSNIEFAQTPNKGVYIGYKHDVPNVIKEKHFFTEGIRTCTGGGIVTPHKEALGFHIWDDRTNKNNFQKISNNMFRWMKEPSRGLLIGSKELIGSPFSIEQFQNFKKVFTEKIKNLTLFEQHSNTCSESNISYSLDDDTWMIATDYFDREIKDYVRVNSLETLKKAFKKIKIAQGDTLILGGKEYTQETAPELYKN